MNDKYVLYWRREDRLLVVNVGDADMDRVVTLPCVMHSAGECATCTAMVHKRCSGTQALRNVSAMYRHHCKGV